MTNDDTSHLDPRTPILVGSGQVTDTISAPSSKRPPTEFVAEAARLALADARPAQGVDALARKLDAIAVLRFFSDSSPRFVSPFGRSTNPPKSVANRIGAINVRDVVYTQVGGNVPQSLLNDYAEKIAAGEISAAMVSGGELLRTGQTAQRQKLDIDWNETLDGEPRDYGDTRLGWSSEEDRHGLRAAIYFYPLIENAIRGDLGRSPGDHLKAMGKLFARFAAVARDNPLANRREGHSAERLATIDAENRYISWPYPRLMNANAYIDQSAAVVMTSVGLACELGIPRDRWVFLHGCAEGADTWITSERAELHRSAAIRACARTAFDMAGKTLADMKHIDLYSCFTSAVQIGCREIGIDQDDPRGLTVTGGLPFFGGPGNNYVTHSIAEMMNRLRAHPGDFGLVTANGSYVTKHAAGVYSTTPVKGPWRRDPPKKLQGELDKLPKVRVETAPNGATSVETYTVAFGREKPERGFVFGRLENGDRFIAHLPDDPAILADFVARDQLGRPGTVRAEAGHNVFTPG